MRDEIRNTTGKKYLKSISDGEKRRRMSRWSWKLSMTMRNRQKLEVTWSFFLSAGRRVWSKEYWEGVSPFTGFKIGHHWLKNVAV